ELGTHVRFASAAASRFDHVPRVLIAVAQVEVVDVDATVVATMTGMENPAFARIAITKHPYCARGPNSLAVHPDARAVLIALRDDAVVRHCIGGGAQFLQEFTLTSL